ncbi:DNA polymerase III subunit delta [Synechococcus sp. A10-1-5-1]|uniref:DNA polymerase III subunit delta n=1 Tax=Synechococcus sp. A10-1-5-1 TaxID=2936507 RepID=UPI0020014CA3|nr:DNA polymerase III subunit delta [Synechococcus sp. A10-1-5-1]UPM49294.1 DNA polymerase III subunit delta [Synechococcus sp. A10-1-5-1]
MPIHLIWGDDEAARSRAVEALVKSQVDPSWQSINLSRLDGNDASQAAQALEEARTAPFGAGDRVIVLQRSPFCNQCPADLAEQLEATLNLVAEQCHLVLVNAAKPDGRLKTTKALQKLVKSGEAKERSFQLPAIWDGSGQVDLVLRTAQELGLKLQPDAAQALSDAIGSDSARLASELEKLSLYVGADQTITAQAVEALIGGQATNALQVGDALLAGAPAEAVALVDVLLAANEPALRIVATLCGQIRGWLWVSLLDQQGENDVNAIAKAAGIGNPKRIYVMRKQIRGRKPERFLALLSQLLQVEASLKRGADPVDAFRDGFLLAP